MAFLLQAVVETEGIVSGIYGNWEWLLAGLILVGIAVAVLHFLKNILVHSILGLIGWAIVVYVFNVSLPFWATLFASAVFGLAGLGVMLLLAFFGVL
jgi:uncharacterized membrane protein YjjB (DUF3815 family)